MFRIAVRPLRTRRIIWISLASIGFAFILIAAVFYLTGGRWFVIQTPSMGQYAPVGTLVLTTVAGLTGLHKGSTIAFHPPTAPAEVYFHRILSIGHGAIRTKGDINGTIDPWTLHAHDLVGGELVRFEGLGWIVEALPILLIGGLILQVITHFYVIGYWRFPVRVMGWSVLISLAAYIIRPFVRAVLLTQVVAHGAATSSLVPTGLFDLTAQAVRGSTTLLSPGEVGTVTTTHVATNGLFEVQLAPDLDLGAWLALAAVWLIPTLLCVIYAARHPHPDRESDRAKPSRRKRAA
jgi:hypothetical protein